MRMLSILVLLTALRMLGRLADSLLSIARKKTFPILRCYDPRRTVSRRHRSLVYHALASLIRRSLSTGLPM
jgi:hypothetical protein